MEAWLPTPLRLRADPRFTGDGVTVALVDAGFHPHPDLTRPRNRVRAWADAGGRRVLARSFRPTQVPRWPGWDGGSPYLWHGLMTSSIAAGNGGLSGGRFRGVAPDADLVLVQARDRHGRISNAVIARALDWLRREGPRWGVRVVNVSVYGDPVGPGEPNPVDEAVERLVGSGVVVTAAAGNDGRYGLLPPATAPAALAVGGVDDHNSPDPRAWRLWHGNFGPASDGSPKPDLLAPSFGLVAPVLPESAIAAEARELFDRQALGDPGLGPRLAALKLVARNYQHMEGTSVAAPAVAGVVACLLQAHPGLTPDRVRDLLTAACHRLPRAPRERQGAGAVMAAPAAARALAERLGAPVAPSPVVLGRVVRFRLADPDAASVAVVGSWDRWHRPGLAARAVSPGLWLAELPRPRPGRYRYHFVLDGDRRLPDPLNPAIHLDGESWDSVLRVPRG
jgi:serine protease AprX